MAEFLGAIGIAARFSSLTVSETILRYETTAERAEQQPQTRLRPAHTTYGEFDVTDVGDPPKPRAIGYDYYGGKFSELECMFIGSFGDKFPRGVPVERRRVIDFQRSRGAPFLPKVGTDSKIVQELIRGDPRKTLSYVFLDDPGTQLSRNEVLKQIKKLLDECKKHGGINYYSRLTHVRRYHNCFFFSFKFFFIASEASYISRKMKAALSRYIIYIYNYIYIYNIIYMRDTIKDETGLTVRHESCFGRCQVHGCPAFSVQ